MPKNSQIFQRNLIFGHCWVQNTSKIHSRKLKLVLHVHLTFVKTNQKIAISSLKMAGRNHLLKKGVSINKMEPDHLKNTSVKKTFGFGHPQQRFLRKETLYL